MYISKDDPNRNYFLYHCKNIVKTKDGYVLQTVYREVDDNHMCSKGQRRFHKLNEWSGQDNSNVPNFISWARVLPYAQELIFFDELETK